MKKYLSWLLISIVAITFTSCEEEIDARVSGLVGSWEMIGTQDGAPLPGQDNIFTFYDNCTGLYEAYDELGNWEEYPFEWEWESGFSYQSKIVYIYIGHDTWTYNYYIDEYGYLRLLEYSNPNVYSIYRPLY